MRKASSWTLFHGGACSVSEHITALIRGWDGFLQLHWACKKNGEAAVIGALFPMALGHAISIGIVVLVIALAQQQLPEDVLRIACAVVLFGFGVYKFFSARHPKWVGMRVNFKDLTIWSFLMASAHGAGLMLVPLLLRTCLPLRHQDTCTTHQWAWQIML